MRWSRGGWLGPGVAGSTYISPQPGSQSAALPGPFTAPTCTLLLSASRAGVGRGEEEPHRGAASSLQASPPTFLGEEDKRPASRANPWQQLNSFRPRCGPCPSHLLCPFLKPSLASPGSGAVGVGGGLEEREGGWRQAGLCEHRDGGSGRKAREPALRREAEGERMEGKKVRAAGGGCLGGRWRKPRPNP